MNPLDNLMQALQSLGTGTPESAQALQQGNAADQQLNQPPPTEHWWQPAGQGSIMGSARADPRAAQAAQGPAMSTVRDLVNALNPINWMGGPAGASSAVMAPTANPELQQLIAQLTKIAPKLMERVQGVPERISSYMTNEMPRPNTVGTFQPSQTLPSGMVNILASQPQAEKIPTLAHELAHASTQYTGGNAMSLAQPGRASETAAQLTAMMGTPEQVAMSSYIPQSSNTQRGLFQGPVEELLQRLAGGRRELRPIGLDARADPRTAYTEAVSHATESMLRPQGAQGADPYLEAIMNALGHGIR